MKNIKVIGKTATGKTHTIREILLHATPNQTIIVHDVVGNLYKDVKDTLEANGYKTRILDMNAEISESGVEELVREIMSEKTVLFLKSNYQNSEAANIFANKFIERLNAWQEQQAEKQQIYFFMDEMQNFPLIENLEEVLFNTIGNEMMYIMFFQSYEQVKLTYDMENYRYKPWTTVVLDELGEDEKDSILIDSCLANVYLATRKGNRA
ncbi:MAG: type IV secretory system conjugative DNA transfer family protein [Lachnospiraceae bacterium]|nr:type IV secretory system conjugative DNA transfer family protein [Lachnospiraceae bacterium]